MCCKLVKGKDFVAFQCSNIGEREMTHKEITGKERLEPYYEDECSHDNRFENKGYLTCEDCGYIYDESTLSWIKKSKIN